METEQTQVRPNETALRQQAEEDTRAHGQKSGRGLDDDFENPQCGQPGHLCTDRRGRYVPSWMQLFIYEMEGKLKKGQRQYCSIGTKNKKSGQCGVKEWMPPVAMWVDVPAWVVSQLENAVESITTTDTEEAMRLGLEEAPVVVEEKPRFHLKTLPSA